MTGSSPHWTILRFNSDRKLKKYVLHAALCPPGISQLCLTSSTLLRMEGRCGRSCRRKLTSVAACALRMGGCRLSPLSSRSTAALPTSRVTLKLTINRLISQIIVLVLCLVSMTGNILKAVMSGGTHKKKLTWIIIKWLCRLFHCFLAFNNNNNGCKTKYDYHHQ